MMRIRKIGPSLGALVCALALVSPATSFAQGVSEWGVWDSPRRAQPPPSAYDDPNDDQDYDNRDEERRYGYRRGDDDDDHGTDENGGRRDDDGRDGDGNDEPDLSAPPQDEFGSQRAEDNRTPGVTGGSRPYIAAVAPPRVPFRGPYEAGSIVIDTGGRKLYYVINESSAFAYSIGVGRIGFAWTGSEKVSRIQDWPDWYPPADMRRRKPELPARMLGGIRNPLGVKAIYLGNTLYRIHGTNDPQSIGKAESSGCFRMLNENVLHLASLVHVGTPVTVVRSLNGGVASNAKPPRARDEERRRDYRDDQNDDDWRYQNEARYQRRAPFVDRSDPYWEDPDPYAR